jgi:hypothetical protein
MKQLIISVVGLVLMSSTCLPTARKPENLEDMYVKEFLRLDDDKGNAIVGSKYCTESNEYKFIYQLDNGMWVASNQTWSIGDRVMLMSIQSDTAYAAQNNKKLERKD